MQGPRFYSFSTMMVNDWFDLLDHKAQPEQESDEQVAAYLYSVTSEDDFDLNQETHESGLYIMRASLAIAEEISQNESLKVHKFSFSELVFLSDIFSTAVQNLIPDDEEIYEIADKGEAASYLKEFPSAEGLIKMRERVWAKYFGHGLVAIVRRFFSALRNFFIKYNKYVDTGIYWPGNSCAYADQVIDQLNRIKRIFIRYAYEASKDILSDRLGITVDELEGMEFGAIRRLYRQKALETHPDKNRASDAAVQFEKINSIWEDFAELNRLKGELKVDELGEEDEELFFEKEPVSPGKILIDHSFKALPALPAPIAIS